MAACEGSFVSIIQQSAIDRVVCHFKEPSFRLVWASGHEKDVFPSIFVELGAKITSKCFR